MYYTTTIIFFVLIHGMFFQFMFVYCIHSDVIESADDPNKFIFYELYIDQDAENYHQQQSYFKEFVAFVESGGADIGIQKAKGLFMTK